MRPTKTITLNQSKASITLYTYLTGGQYRDLQKSFLEGVEVDPNNPQAAVNKIPANAVFKQQEMTIGFMVKDIFDSEGKKIEDTKKFVYDLPIPDSDQLYDEVNKLTSTSQLSSEDKKK